jgi:lipoyl(octanoyl) transferase
MGSYNMAIDEAILQSVGSGNSLPTLRFYAWNPLCLSLGYGQRVRDVDWESLDTHAWDIVRRPTGGKAILHGNELTYSVSLPKDHELAQGDIVASYRRISQALINSMQLLGLSPSSEEQPKGNHDLGPVCFEVPSHYEITSGGKKLIGSAQLRRREGILQHGTLPLYGDIDLICDVLAYSDETHREQTKLKIRERATTLEQVLGERVLWQRAADVLAQGFIETFAIEFEQGILSQLEVDTTEKLIQERYENLEWTNKR